MYIIYNVILQIYRNDVDRFDAQIPPSCPSILATVSAGDRPDTATRLKYCVMLRGIKPDNKMLYILRSLGNSSTGKF